jgi:hypothetical protein
MTEKPYSQFIFIFSCPVASLSCQESAVHHGMSKGAPDLTGADGFSGFSAEYS